MAVRINRADVSRMVESGYTYAAIGKYYGVSRQRIHQIHKPHKRKSAATTSHIWTDQEVQKLVAYERLGMKPGKIAELLGIPVGKVYGKLYALRKAV